MKIKASQSKTANLKFGAALLFILFLFFGSLYFMSKERAKANKTSKIIDTSESANLKFSPELLELQISKESFEKITQKRKEAIQKGLLFTSNDDLVPADMRIDNHSFPINIRLKGDLADHLREDKLSYRIELKNGEQWRDMTEFSIHNSKARSHVAEWYMHQLFMLEGIMSTQYDFIEVKENGKSRGVYAYEEHFTDQLLTAHKKPIGPILKHNDDAYWENVQKDIKPLYWTKALEIDLFNNNHKGDEDFMRSYEYAKSILNDFINSKLPAVQVFDLDQMAKYYALMELSHGFHAQQITNIRFYFNPLTARLEPIAFDCFGVELPAVTEDWSAAGEGINGKTEPLEGYPYGGVYMHLLFQDKDFVEQYLAYLYKFSQQDYLDAVNAQLGDYAKVREAYIQKDEEYKEYAFSVTELFKKAMYTRKKILPLPNYSIKVFTKQNSRRDLITQSFHYFPLEIIGFGSEDQLLDTLQKKVFLEAFNKDTQQDQIAVRNKYEYNQLFYQVLGIDSLFSAYIPMNNFPKANDISTGATLSDLQQQHSIDVTDKHLSFETMNIKIEEPVMIPKGFIVSIKPGQTMSFSGKGCLISNSPVYAKGNQKSPIKFIAEGKEGQALLITGDETDVSVFEHCHFKGLHSMNSLGIHTSAGLTIATGIDLSNSFFNDIKGQSALSILNGEVHLQEVDFSGCAGDALICNYMSGQLMTMRFDSIGGDAVKAQFSNLDISNSYFNNISGEAIKGYKMQTLNLADINISNSFEGIGIQKSALTTIENIDFTNVFNALHLEGSQNYLTNTNCENVQFTGIENRYVVDEYSTLMVNNKRVF